MAEQLTDGSDFAALANVVVRPNFESKLVPLLHFKGHANLGRIHRYWNLLMSAQLNECPDISSAVKMSGDNKFLHLCEPHNAPTYMQIHSFLSRVWMRPDVMKEQPGLRDYVGNLFVNSRRWHYL